MGGKVASSGLSYFRTKNNKEQTIFALLQTISFPVEKKRLLTWPNDASLPTDSSRIPRQF